MSKKKPSELPADWFCEDQTDLLDLIDEEDSSDDADADPDRV